VRTMRLLAILTFCTALAASCGTGGTQTTPGPDPPPVVRPTFDQTRAFADLVAQVDFGARTPGSRAHDECKAFLIDRLTTAGARVVTHDFSSTTPLGDGEYDFTNILGVFSEGKGDGVLLLAAHWDSRAKATRDPEPARRIDPVPGANDGASGVSVLLEMARAFTEAAPPRTTIICFFDAEDQGVSGSGLPQSGWAIGSRELAANWPEALPWPDEMILLDLIGGDNVHNAAVGTPTWSNDVFDLPMEPHSLQNAPDLVDRVWTIAERRGHTAFQRRTGTAVSDDHIAFQERGVAAIDIIDFVPPEWDTTHDTPENCDAGSLYQVGDTLLEFVYAE